MDPPGFCRPCEGYQEPGNGDSGKQSLFFLHKAWPPYLPCGDMYLSPCGGTGGTPVLIVSISLQINYKKDALANYPNFTSVVDPPEIVLAKINSVNQSDVSLLCV